MAKYTPDGTLLEVLGKGEEGEEQEDPKDPAQGEEDGASSGHSSGCSGRHGSSGACRCGGIGTYDPGAPGPHNILDQLVTALHDAGLDANPKCHCRQNLDAQHLGRRNPHGIEDSYSEEGEDN